MSNLKFVAYPAIVLLSLAAAVSAHAAGDITTDTTATQTWAKTKTRAQVQQELFAARADGSVVVGEIARDPVITAQHSTKTRAEVLAELRADHGKTARMVGEDSGSFYLSQLPLARDASRVLAGAPGSTTQR